MRNALQNPPQTPKQKQPEPSNNDDNPQMFTCEICIEPTENKFRNGDDGCSHPFCTDCVVKYIRAKLENDNAGRIQCPALSCDRTLSPHACESVVGPSLFVRWCDVLCEEAIVDLDRCYCPYAKCSALIVNECGGIARKSKCPECRMWFCFNCKRAWHAGFGCKNGDWKDIAFERLAKDRKWMRCPGCSHFVDRVDGCSIVRCRCGINFCYKCGKQVNQHLHRCGRDRTWIERFFRWCAYCCTSFRWCVYCCTSFRCCDCVTIFGLIFLFALAVYMVVLLFVVSVKWIKHL